MAGDKKERKLLEKTYGTKPALVVTIKAAEHGLGVYIGFRGEGEERIPDILSQHRIISSVRSVDECRKLVNQIYTGHVTSDLTQANHLGAAFYVLAQNNVLQPEVVNNAIRDIDRFLNELYPRSAPVKMLNFGYNRAEQKHEEQYRSRRPDPVRWAISGDPRGKGVEETTFHYRKKIGSRTQALAKKLLRDRGDNEPGFDNSPESDRDPYIGR